MKPKKYAAWSGNLSFIPCSITFCNALCGLFAIFFVVSHFSGSSGVIPVQAIWLIGAAIFFDCFDGFAARKLKAESLHGMQLDSLADLLSFGIAPAIMIFSLGVGWWNGHPGKWIPWAAGGCYMICTMWRLAQYNTLSLSDEPEKEGFTGLPSPAAALVLCSVILLLNRIGPGPRTVAFVVAAYGFSMGFMMVSSFEYMHGKKLVCFGPAPLRIALLALSILALLGFGEYAAFALVHLYLFSGPLAEIIEKGRAFGDERMG